MGEFHENYDLYLTPVTAAPPARIGELLPGAAEKAAMAIISVLRLGRLAKATGMIQKLALDILARTPFTQLANFTGQPAMSLPLYEHASGLPCGVQVMAPFGEEALLFRTAAQMEKARPWFHKRPPLRTDQESPADWTGCSTPLTSFRRRA
jgi:amidase